MLAYQIRVVLKLAKRRVGGYNASLLDLGLGRQQAIERIAVRPGRGPPDGRGRS